MNREILDRPGMDDPIWVHLLTERLEPYLPSVRNWWNTLDKHIFTYSGLYDLDGPPGLCVRFTRVAARSPIKGIQAFPLVPTGFLQLTRIQGGSTKMVESICTRGFTIEEFTIISKINLPSIINKGQFLAFIPTDIYEGVSSIGKWVYFTNTELIAIYNGTITDTIKQKILLKL